ncbi:MAG: S9 family peptidase [Ktedonobacteraceae bacterium]|nr:S9 family peptidase [Ktedonobacteraceae bacterium]
MFDPDDDIPTQPGPIKSSQTEQDNTPTVEASPAGQHNEHQPADPAPSPTPAQPAETGQAGQTEQTTQTLPAAPAPPTALTGTSVQKKAPEAPEAQPVQPPFMAIDDLLDLRIAGDPQVSPDGRWIAFTILSCDRAKNTTHSTLWLVSSNKTEPPRRLTDGEQYDTMPRWSPDGRTLAFLSNRAGTPQIYLLPMQGGEARRLSTLHQGVTEYHWRPDGASLLAHSYWRPEDEQETDDGSETAQIYHRLDAQREQKGHRYGRYQQLWLVPVEGPALRLTSEPVDLVQSCWSPDGNEVVFCANRRPDPDLSKSMALWVLNVTTGQMRRLTPEEGIAQAPAWSPDGQTIAYLFTADQTKAGNYAPWLVAAHGNDAPHEAVAGTHELNCQCRVIDELRSEWLTPPRWTADSKALLVPVQERGQVHLYRLDLAGQHIERLTSGNGRYLSPHISSNGQVVALVRADWFTPGDIWSLDSSGQNLRKLTGVNDHLLHQRQLIRPRRVSWQSSDGLAIDGWLYLPPAASQTAKVPLILAPHGGPFLAWGDSYVHEFQVLAGRGYAVLAPNPRGSAGYGEEFSRKALHDWGGADFHDLIAGLDYVIEHEPVDEQRLAINGISYGGYLACWAITQSTRFKAAVSRNGFSSLDTVSLLSDQAIWFDQAFEQGERRKERSPLTFVDRITTPLLLLPAADDLNCPFSESLQLFVALRKQKKMVELVRYPSASHLMDWPDSGTPRQRIDRLLRTVAWFERYV